MKIENEGIIIGRNAVIEALRADVTIDKVFIAKGDIDATLKHIAAAAREAGAAVVETDRRKLDSLCSGQGNREHIESDGLEHHGEYAHQGVVAVTAVTEYSTINDILENAKAKGREPLIVICDEISDPHNLGAIIRTAEATGADGIIIPKRRNAGLSPTVVKSSSGAVFHIKIVKVANISAAIRELKEKGVWVYGAAADGEESLWKTDFTGATALVIGSEGKGISRLVGENCDYKVSIPMDGRLSSLNASVSAAVLLYEAYRQRQSR